MQNHNLGSWQSSLQTLVYILLFLILFGWLLKVGQGFLLPILVATIAMYILITLSHWLVKFPVLKSTPEWFRRILVLISFIVVMVQLISLVITTGQKILAKMPIYEANIEQVFLHVNAYLGWSNSPDWQIFREMLMSQINLQSLITSTLTSFSALTGMFVVIIVYALFLLNERDQFVKKLMIAFPDGKTEQTRLLIADINKKISEYLVVKTLINLILATICFVILWACGVEYALFWALIIGLFNYIPYVGSLFGVIFPVLMTLAQTGSLKLTILVAILLTVAQMFVGNFLEPRMIGKQINLSPFVVLLSLSLWSSLWGIAGAILAIPLTSIFVIVLEAFRSTRPFAILLMQNPKNYDQS
ncbi:AI-2E family transporter [Acinetobacter haemolyticus]|uniref:AI-2E family transporter n=1 Tax=Acinetobacter haemolyticus TaxID=29430 RepID=UPI00038082C5|nr:AI-2E family transporter [Acinetobacter haemolyticus]